MTEVQPSKTPRHVSFARPDRAFLVLGGLTALVLLLLTPPFQVPDERAHFFRAFAISEGRLTGARSGARAGVMIPESLMETKNAWEQGLAFHPEARLDLARVKPTFRMPLDPERRRFKAISNVLAHSPIPYLPQALGIAFGRVLGAPPIGLFYLGRLANAVTALLLCFLAIRLVPFGKWSVLLMTLTPIFCFLRSSLSPDAVTYSLAFANFSAGIALATAGARDSKPTRVYLATSALLLLSKYAYFWVPLVILIGLPGRRRGEGLLRLLLTAYSVGLVLVGAWYSSVQEGLAPLVAGSDPRARLGAIFSDPLGHLTLLMDHFTRSWASFYRGLIGSLGWTDTPLPDWFRHLYWLVLAAVALTQESPRLGRLPRLLLVGIALAGYLVIVNAIFLLMPMSAHQVRGVQSRYLIPLLPFVVLAASGARPVEALARHAPALCSGLAVVSLLVTAATLVTRYYVRL